MNERVREVIDELFRQLNADQVREPDRIQNMFASMHERIGKEFAR